MALPNIYRLNRCCGCLSLQSGSTVIGIIGMLFMLILICWQLVLIVVNEQCYSQVVSQPNMHGLKFKHQFIKDENNSIEDDDDDKSDHMSLKEFSYIENPHNGKNIFQCPHWIKFREPRYNYNTARFILGMTAVMLCIYFFLIAMMVHGVRTGRPNMMAPCLMWTLVHIVFAVLTLIGIGHLPPSDIISELCVLFLLTYFFCVVNSYYHQLRESQNGGAGALVVAMSRHDRNNLNTSEMFVTIPSPRKADLPPPYPGMDNPNYSPYLSNAAACGMEAANYAVPPYSGPGVDPPGYNDICGGTSDSLATSLPPPPAYSFSNINNVSQAESQALSPAPPLGFASSSQDVLPLRPENNGVTTSQSLTTADEGSSQGVVSDNMMSENIVRNPPMAAINTTGNEIDNAKEACTGNTKIRSKGTKSSMKYVVDDEDETSLGSGFVNPAYDGCNSTASATVLPPPQQYGTEAAVLPPPQQYGTSSAVLPPPQQYGDVDSVQGATTAASDTTESQMFQNNYPTSKV